MCSVRIRLKRHPLGKATRHQMVHGPVFALSTYTSLPDQSAVKSYSTKKTPVLEDYALKEKCFWYL